MQAAAVAEGLVPPVSAEVAAEVAADVAGEAQDDETKEEALCQWCKSAKRGGVRWLRTRAQAVIWLLPICTPDERSDTPGR